MFQKLLTGYLTLALAVGQSLCCCSVPLHAAAETSHGAGKAAAAKRPARSADDRCCCRSESDTGECDKASRSPGAHSPNEQHKCPCRDNSAKEGPAAPGTVTPTALNPASERPQWLCSVVAILQPVAINATSFSARALDSIYPSATEILRAFHILRC